MQNQKEELKRAAYSGEEIDINRLCGPEIMLYMTMRSVYAMYREGRLTKETAQKYTRRIEKEYDLIKADYEIVRRELDRRGKCEYLECKYAKEPTKENALALIAEAFPSMAYRKEEYKQAERDAVWDE